MNIKKLKKLFIFSLIASFISLPAFSAYLGFRSKETIVKPGDPFTIDLVVFFEKNDREFWSEDPVVRVSLYDWIGSISVFSSDWNNSQWIFNKSNTYFSETDTTSFFWAEATPFSRNSLTSSIRLATLHCFAYDTFGETFEYDMATNYFGIDDNGLSYKTDGYEKIYTNLPTSIICGETDILGESNNSKDGIDKLDIEVYDMPSYKIELTPSALEIPLTISPTLFEIKISKMAEVMQPAAYDHLRLVLEYNHELLKCVELDSIKSSIPDFFTNVTVSVFTNNYYGTAITENVVIEGFCNPTDFEGVVAAIKLLPLKMESDAEVDLSGWFIGKSTVLDRFGKADLLESADDDTDGFSETFFNITNVPGLFFKLENSKQYYITETEAEAQLVLKRELSKNTAIDSLIFEFLYNTNLISMIAPEFSICSNLINLIGTNPTIDFSIQENLVLTNSSLSNQFSCFWTNSKVRLNITFSSPLILTQATTKIGVFNFMSKFPGELAFLPDKYKIIYNDSSIEDTQKQMLECPFTFSVLDADEEDSQLFVALVPDENNPKYITPGHFVDFNIYCYSRQPVSNASYFLSWTYDNKILNFETVSSSITNLDISISSNETSSVFCIQSDNHSSASGTNLLGKITFKTILPETVFLNPVTFDMSENHYCRFEKNGDDILGSSWVNDDGVSGGIIDIESVDSLTLIVEPSSALFAGLQEDLYLEIQNPENYFWDYCSLKIIFDKEEILVTSNVWITNLSEQFQLLSNSIKVINIPILITNINDGITNVFEVTNEWFEASLALKSLTPTNFSGRIASLPIIPLEDSPYWEYIFDNNTRFSLNNILITDRTLFNSDYWNVNPNYMVIELKDQVEAPILGVDYTITAQIKNPLSISINRTTVCWSFDSTVMEIKEVELLNGFSGDIWINNNNDSFGYLCADLHNENFISASNIPIMNITLYPKVVELLEMDPDEIVMDDELELELGMGVFSKNKINLFELLWGANHPNWERQVVYRPMPQLQFDDIEIDKNSYYLIEDLFFPGEGLVNGDDYLNQNLLWWTEENANIDVVFNSMLNTAKFTPKYNWVGEEIFRIYCKDSNGRIGSTLLRVFVEDTAFELEVLVVRNEYLAASYMDFSEIEFSIKNSTTNNLEVTAFIIAPNNTTNYPDIQNIDTGAIISSPKNFAKGRLICKKFEELGFYYGTVIVKNSNNDSQYSLDSFVVEVVKAYIDTDGDRFTTITKNVNSCDLKGRAIYIDSNSDNASIKVKVFKNPDGDGRIALDSIKCNRGLKSVCHAGDIKLIEANGPIGSIKIKNGIVGSIIAKKGGVNSVDIVAYWDNYGEEFFEVALLGGIFAQGDIGTVKVIGGNIGEDFQPAIISSDNGNIKNIITKMIKKTYYDGAPIPDNKYTELATGEGANIFSSIYAPNGNIGLIKAIGGSIGIPDADEYSFTEIKCKGDIKTVSATAKKGDGEILGGYIHSDILCGGHINKIMAIGGDILHEQNLDPDEVSDNIPINTIYITASSIKKIESRCKVYLFKEGEKDPEWWYWEAHGGNMILDIRKPANSNPIKNVFSIGKILAVGGNLSSYIESFGSIKKIQAKNIKFHEDLDTGNILRGGNLVFSSIKPNIEDKDLSNPELFSYNGFIKSLSIDASIRNTRIFSKGPFNANKIKYGVLKDNSEIWIDGKKVLASN